MQRHVTTAWTIEQDRIHSIILQSHIDQPDIDRMLRLSYSRANSVAFMLHVANVLISHHQEDVRLILTRSASVQDEVVSALELMRRYIPNAYHQLNIHINQGSSPVSDVIIRCKLVLARFMSLRDKRINARLLAQDTRKEQYDYVLMFHESVTPETESLVHQVLDFDHRLTTGSTYVPAPLTEDYAGYYISMPC